MAVFLYIDRRGPLHDLHPGVKLAGMVAFFFAAFVGERPELQVPLAVGVAGLIHLGGAWPNVLRLRVLFLLVFFMTLIVWSLFYRGGSPWWQMGPVAISPEGVRFAMAIAIKLVTFLGIGLTFLSTTRIEEFAYALTRLGVPYKIGFTMTLAFRLVPVFLESAATVVQAQRCRGFRFDEGGFVERVRRYVPVIVPVFIGALRRADAMAMALEARGFQSDRPRTSLERYSFRAMDGGALAALLALGLTYAWLWSQGLTTIQPR